MAYSAMKPNSPRFQRHELESRIQGWGADLDPAKRPAVPKEKTPLHGTGAHWITPEQQVAHVKINKSIEHKELTATFGSTCPPKGISGLLRNYAYKYSEGHMGHWLVLLLADRVDVLENRALDLMKGRGFNPLAEAGLKSELTAHGLKSRVGGSRYDVTNRIPKEILVAVGIVTIGFLASRHQSQRKAA